MQAHHPSPLPLRVPLPGLPEDRKYDADAWVVALAVEMKASYQQTIIEIKRIVVTEESGGNVKVSRFYRQEAECIIVCYEVLIEVISNQRHKFITHF